MKDGRGTHSLPAEVAAGETEGHSFRAVPGKKQPRESHGEEAAQRGKVVTRFRFPNPEVTGLVPKPCVHGNETRSSF